MIADTMHAALRVIKREMPPQTLAEAVATYRRWREALNAAEGLRIRLTRFADAADCNHYAFLQAIGLHADGLAERITTNREGATE